jgi:hypothetical protein
MRPVAGSSRAISEHAARVIDLPEGSGRELRRIRVERAVLAIHPEAKHLDGEGLHLQLLRRVQHLDGRQQREDRAAPISFARHALERHGDDGAAFENLPLHGRFRAAIAAKINIHIPGQAGRTAHEALFQLLHVIRLVLEPVTPFDRKLCLGESIRDRAQGQLLFPGDQRFAAEHIDLDRDLFDGDRGEKSRHLARALQHQERAGGDVAIDAGLQKRRREVAAAEHGVHHIVAVLQQGQGGLEFLVAVLLGQHPVAGEARGTHAAQRLAGRRDIVAKLRRRGKHEIGGRRIVQLDRARLTFTDAFGGLAIGDRVIIGVLREPGPEALVGPKPSAARFQRIVHPSVALP